MNLVLQGIVVYVGMAWVDICYALYTRRVTEGRALQSGLLAALLLALGGYVVISYTSHAILLLPACLGAFTGTYLAVRLDHKRTGR